MVMNVRYTSCACLYRKTPGGECLVRRTKGGNRSQSRGLGFLLENYVKLWDPHAASNAIGHQLF